MSFDCTSKNLKIAYNESDGVVFSTESGNLCYVDPENAKQLIEMQKLLDSGVENEKVSELKDIIEDGFSGLNKIQQYPIRPFYENRSLDVLEIMTQTDCNLRCKYCYAHGGSYQYGRKSLDPKMISKYIIALVEQFLDNIKLIKFFGGEPLGNPDCIIEVCKCINDLVALGKLNKMPLFGVVTNGTFYSEQLSNMFKKYNFFVTFSLDGWKEINDLQRVDQQNNGTHDDVVQNIQAYKNAGLPQKNMMVEVTYTQNHIDQKIAPLELMQYVIDTIGINSVLIAPCISSGKLGISPENAFQVYDNVAEISYENLKKIGLYIDYSTLSNIRKLSGSYSCESICITGHENISILPDGRIYPCHMFLTDDYCMGYYTNDKWELNDCQSILQKLSKVSFKPNRCKQCWARNVCFYCPGLYASLSDDFIFGCGERCFRELLIEKYLLLASSVSQKEDSLNYMIQKLDEL